MAYKPKVRGVVSDINVTPMADVMLVLLIIFMVVTPMLQKGVSVDLAKTNNPRQMENADKEDAVVIAITRDGRTYIGATPVKREEITEKVKDRIASKLDKTVYLRCDARAKYGTVVSVVDDVRAAGVDQLGLLTERIERRRGGGAAVPEAGGMPPPTN
jgi:biopolymer transport protein ExbD/biopolymer transport protein TolR